MNNNKLDIDAYTSKLVNKSGLDQPSANFTEKVMSKILKNPSVNINFADWVVMACAVLGIAQPVIR